MASCYYLNSAAGIPVGESALDNFNLTESIYYHITWNPDIADDEYCSPGGDEEGYDMTVEGVRVRCSMVHPNYYCSWRSGNALTTLIAHKPEIDLVGIAASLIRAQAKDPLTNDRIDRIVDEATSEEYIKEIIHQKGSTT